MKAITRTFLLVFTLMLGLTLTASAQRKPASEAERKERLEKIESARTAFITDKLNLTPEQAQKFWPLYNEYNQKRRELRMKGRPFRGRDLENLTDKQVEEGLQKMFEVRQAELDLEKSYAEKFQKIISTRQLALLYQSEREFTKVLLKRLENRPAKK